MIKRVWLRSWYRMPLAVKFSLAISFLIASAVVILSGLSVLREQMLYHQELEGQAALILEGLSITLNEAFQQSNPEDLDRLVSQLNQPVMTAQIRLYDAAGQIVAGPPDHAQVDPVLMALGEQSGPVYSWTTDSLIAGRRIGERVEASGAVVIELPTVSLHAKISETKNQGLLVAAIILTAGVIVTVLLSRSITEPVEELVRATHRIAGGDLKQQVTVQTSDELSILAEAFNEMTQKLQHTMDREGAIVDAAKDGIISLDREGRVLEINPAAEDMVQRTQKQVLGRPLDDLLRISPNGRAAHSLTQALKAGGEELLKDQMEALALRKDGGTVPIELAFSRVQSSGPVRFTAILHDISERKAVETALRQTQTELEERVEKRTNALAEANEALQQQMEELERTEAALRESEERYALAMRGANDGLWDWNLRTNQVHFSPRWKSMLGFGEDEIEADIEAWYRLVHPEDLSQLRSALATHLNGMSPHFEFEQRIRHKDGAYRWVLSRGLAVRDEDGRAYRMAGSLSDITERKNAEEQLVHDAFHDALTGLPNRALFMDRLGRAIERTRRRDGYYFAVLFLDLDRFKVINDSLGHSIGDKLLLEIARRLEIILRSTDTVARLGGDEFVILLDDLEADQDALQVAERIHAELALPFYPSSKKVFTSASIGIVLSTSGYQRPEGVLRDADIAMYRAKSLGGARHEVFNPEMRERAMARLELETDLRRAIGFQEFKVFYQPIMSLDTHRIMGFEALVRWDHPERGLIHPDEFIPVAEETGLIIPIDWWVLQEACRQLAVWQRAFPLDPPLHVSVNVSSLHFSSLDLVRQVENILHSTGLTPDSLKLEITESVFMGGEAVDRSSITKLRDMGIQLQIDDFGTGYSSLSYLQQFPIDTIKIDRTFVSRMDGHVTNSEIVRTIVSLARELNMNAIAEGVETEAQLEQLKQLACEFGQGFFISRPMDTAQAADLIRQMLTESEDES